MEENKRIDEIVRKSEEIVRRTTELTNKLTEAKKRCNIMKEKIEQKRQEVAPKIAVIQKKIDELAPSVADKEKYATYVEMKAKGIFPVFVNLEDVSGSVEVIVFPKLFGKYANTFNNGVAVFVGGRLSVREEEKPKLILDFAETADTVKDKQIRKVGLFVRVDNNQSKMYFECAKYIDDNAKSGDIRSMIRL